MIYAINPKEKGVALSKKWQIVGEWLYVILVALLIVATLLGYKVIDLVDLAIKYAKKGKRDEANG